MTRFFLSASFAVGLMLGSGAQAAPELLPSAPDKPQATGVQRGSDMLRVAQAGSSFPGGKPITFIIPFPPGGAIDVGFRIILPVVEKLLATQVQIVNKGGAGGQTGWTDLVRAKPDGYTIGFLGLPGVLTTYLDTSRGAIYARKDFQPIAQAWGAEFGVSVPAKSPIKDFKELLDMAKAKPNTVMVADGGLLAPQHILTALIEKSAGVSFAPVHFTGGAAATAALLGGHVDAMSGGSGDLVQHRDNGTARVLAVSAENGSQLLPGVPTMKSLGVPVVFSAVVAVAAPAGTPAEVVGILERAFKAAIADPEVDKKLRAAGATPDFMGSKEFSAYWEKYDAEVGPVMQSLLK